MNRRSVIVINPAYLAADVEDDQDNVKEIDPADLAPLTSGSAPIVYNAPASEDGEEAEDGEEDEDGEEAEDEEIPALEDDHSSRDDEEIEDWFLRMSNALGDMDRLQREFRTRPREDTNDPQPYVGPDVGVWDSGRMWEREYQLYPDTSREELNQRFFDQVWNMLRIMQERVEGRTWNKEERYD